MLLGIDIGGTKTDLVLASEDGAVGARLTVPSGQGLDEVRTATLVAVESLLGQAGIAWDQVSSVGVGVPGTVYDGVVTHAQNLSIARWETAADLGHAWGRPVVVDNDVNAAAVGAWMSEGAGDASTALLNLGTGLAAGIILGGRLWRGARGAAGEIGMVSMDPAGPIGPDGIRGGLELLASGSGLAYQSGGLTAQEALAAADTDPAVAAMRQRMFEAVATAVRVLVLTIDVETVLVGGGLTRMGPSLPDGVRKVMREWERENEFMASIDLTARTRFLDPDVPIAAIGAALRGAGRG